MILKEGTFAIIQQEKLSTLCRMYVEKICNKYTKEIKMTNEELINQLKKEIAVLTSQIDESKINYNLPMGSWVSHKESEISDRKRITIKEAGNIINRYDMNFYDDNKHKIDVGLLAQVFDIALDTMQKYQKIEQILDDWKSDGGAFEMSESYWLRLISEVIEDENE